MSKKEILFRLKYSNFVRQKYEKGLISYEEYVKRAGINSEKYCSILNITCDKKDTCPHSQGMSSSDEIKEYVTSVLNTLKEDVIA